MSAAPATRRRRRARRGSLDRPISGRTYRGTWLFVAFPLLLAAFTVTRPAALPRPALPAAFDRVGATQLAFDLAERGARPVAEDGRRDAGGARGSSTSSGRTASSSGATVSRQTSPGADGFRSRISSRSVPGRSPSAIMVVAHRDNSGAGLRRERQRLGHGGADRAGALVREPGGRLDGAVDARAASRRRTRSSSSRRTAARSAASARRTSRSTRRSRVTSSAVVDLDAIAGHGSDAARVRGRQAAAAEQPASLATAAARVLEQSGDADRAAERATPAPRPRLPVQLLRAGAVPRRAGISAVTLTSAGDRPPSEVGDTPGFLHTPKSRARLGQIGRAAQQLLASLDEGLELAAGDDRRTSGSARGSCAAGRSRSSSSRRCCRSSPRRSTSSRSLRRRRVALLPAIRSLRSRVLFWLVRRAALRALRLRGLVAALVAAAARTSRTARARTGRWSGSLVLAGLSLAGWLVARDRLLPRREVDREEELAGHCAALLALALVALLVVALNAFALVFLLPSLHAWLWLAQLGDRPLAARLATWARRASPGRCCSSGSSPAASASASTRPGTSSSSPLWITSRSSHSRLRRVGGVGRPACRARGRPLCAVPERSASGRRSARSGARFGARCSRRAARRRPPVPTSRRGSLAEQEVADA